MSIELQNVTYTYNAGTVFAKTAIDDVSLTISPGEFVGLIGHTGSGKSTLIQHLNALLTPTAGRVLLGGEDINADKSKLRAVRQRVGLVFQYPEHQLFEVSVYKEVAFGLKLMQTPHMEADSRIRDALSAVGLSEDYYEKSPFELSGGEMRRVAIAGVLAMNPSVLILDEPTAGLDPRGRDKILSQIKYMRELLGITVILVSHSMEDIAKLAERIIVMHNGKIALNGTVSEVFSQADKLAECNLTVPQSTILMKELAANGWDISTDVYTTSAARDTITAAVKGDEK